MFVPGRLLQPILLFVAILPQINYNDYSSLSLMFVGKVIHSGRLRSYQKTLDFELECPSLLGPFVNYVRKKFYNIGPLCQML
jgi:hypothetical protein